MTRPAPDEPAASPRSLRARWQAQLLRAGNSWWLGAILVAAFGVSFLQLARLDRYAIDAEKRINNGQEPTYFAVHLNPYYLFSEDFHLYYGLKN